MKLQTQIPLSKETRNPISYDSRIVLLGSCFSENIGKQLDYFRFQNYQNPFGILFHPIAIENLILNTINEKRYSESDVFRANERWHSFDAHSKLSSNDKERLLNNLNQKIQLTRQQIQSATHIIITLGTAWVYRFTESDQIVANCHKIPQKKFLKELLSVDEIRNSLEAIVSSIRLVNPNTSIVFTVSPVRHLKDGFVENQRSKAHLIAAIHEVVNAKNKTHYFPSYEIQMDELRDYRFYKQDMIHPNKIAIEYIWEKFVTSWFSDDTKSSMELVDKIQKGLQHKPFDPKSKGHQAFLKQLDHQIAEIQKKHSHIQF